MTTHLSQPAHATASLDASATPTTNTSRLNAAVNWVLSPIYSLCNHVGSTVHSFRQADHFNS